MSENKLTNIIDNIKSKNGNLSQSAQAYMILYEAIQKYILRPGQPISEKELSEKLNMSRTPIREAIYRLKNDGLVEKKRYKGTFIKSFTKEDIRQIYEIAESLESMAVFLCAKRASEEELKTLNKCILKMEDAEKNQSFEKWLKADQSFHEIIPHICDNQYLAEVSTKYHAQINLIRVAYLHSTGIISASIKDHRETYELIKKGKGDLARKVTQKHWEDIRERTLESIYF